MSKQCPSCSEHYRYLLKCNDCGREFCDNCRDQKFVIIPVLFSKYDPGPGLRSACPNCGTDDYDVISEDDEDEGVEDHPSSDSEDADERAHASTESSRGDYSGSSSSSTSYSDHSWSDTSSGSSGDSARHLLLSVL